ncbi:unnamed protein product [Allacma fusca]|uniref:Uncharacterized protein n=1 Tax=Allacma fusca TaxID=39272 RepID=A0A8J2MBE0_9HEXA|nr:unnamed protein product [Allacma fusca]
MNIAKVIFTVFFVLATVAGVSCAKLEIKSKLSPGTKTLVRRQADAEEIINNVSNTIEDMSRDPSVKKNLVSLSVTKIEGHPGYVKYSLIKTNNNKKTH